jgi:hypothetical protein
MVVSFRMGTLLLAVVAVLAAVALTTQAAQARSYTIRAGEHVVTRLGPFKTRFTRHYAPTIRKAIRAFGRPSRSFRTRYDGCVVKWKRLGLRVEFYNLGYHPHGICHPDSGLAQSFIIKRSKKWRTWKGLRIGMPEKRVWDLHPLAEWVDDRDGQPASYWLRSAYSPFGDGGDYAVVSARLWHRTYGRVVSFEGWIGAAGE